MFNRIILVLLLMLIGLNAAIAQQNREKAIKMAREAITLMDNGEIKKAIALLERCKKLDPDYYLYEYEIAFAHQLNKDFKKSAKLYEKVVGYDSITDQCYQMLGNVYDLGGNPKKAIEAYERGLVKFPNSGRLHLELGIMEMGRKDYDQAILFWEKGIELDPSYPSNYFRAAQLFLMSEDPLWGLLYGELFMNLERNTDRTVQMSRWLFSTYKDRISFTSDTSIAVNLLKTIHISMDRIQDTANFQLPFTLVFGPTFLLALAEEKRIDIASLNRVRSRFIDAYFQQSHGQYQMVLFDFHRRLKELGYFEAYNHWILMKGDEGEFDFWVKKNERQWNDFTSWFLKNPLVLDHENKFLRGNY